ncbi:MAG: hypothetical protein GXY15_03415 [Candidatus Hydrogenedentes bacterium]|nr:hypothetical protein [Candidatus Hydrogenedentota bacterium]
MDQPSVPDKRTESPARPRRRVLRALLVLALLAGAAWMGGLPHRAAFKLAGDFLGGRVSGRLHLGQGGAQVTHLNVRDPEVPLPCLLTAEEMTLSFSPEQGRLFGDLAVRRPILSLVRADDGAANYGFLLRFLAQPSSGWDIERFVPRQVRVTGGAVHVSGHGGVRLQLNGLKADVSLASSTAYSGGVGLDGDMILERGGETLARLTGLREQAAFSAELRADGASASLRYDSPEAGDAADLSLETRTAGGDRELRVSLARLALNRPEWGRLAGSFLPVAFSSVNVEQGKLAAAWRGGAPALDTLALRAAVPGLRVGPLETPWAAGDLAVDIAPGEAPGAFGGSVTFGNLPPLTLSVAQDAAASRLSVRAGVKELPVGALGGAVPAAAALARIPGLKSVTGNAEMVSSPEGLNLAGTASAALAADTATVEFSAVRAAGQEGVEGAAAAHLGDGSATAKMKYGDAGVSLDAALSKLAPAAWWRGITGSGLLDPLALALDGPVAVSLPAAGGWTVQGTLTAPPPGWGGAALPDDWPLSLQASLSGTPDAVTGSLSAAFGDAARATAEKLRFAPGTGAASGDLTIETELGPWAKLAGFPDLWGTLRASAKGSRDAKGDLTAPVTVTLEALGYGGWSLPYGMETTLSADLRAVPSPLRLHAGTVRAALGEDTLFTLESAGWQEGLAVLGGLSFETGLGPLVSKGWLREAEGRAEAHCGALAFGGTAAQGSAPVEYSAAFPRLVLSAVDAALEGVAASGQLYCSDSGWAGAGALSAESCTVAGTRWSAIAGKTRVENGTVLLEEATAAVFGGSVGMTGTAALVDEGMPLRVDMTVSDVDLAVFTQEFKPPSVVLTGRVGGTADLLVRDAKLADLHVDLAASSGFSLNKDMVEQLLTSQYVTTMTGGKQVTALIRDVLGDDPQRAFDAAVLTLALRDGRIEGVARLESRDLNLTMDIKADPAALLEALRAGRDGASAEVANPDGMQ